jgi:hypothetical protein
MPDPTKFRPIADHHIVRLIHKFNPEQKIVQVYLDKIISGIMIVCVGFFSPDTNCYTSYSLTNAKIGFFFEGKIKFFWILVSSTHGTISRNKAAFVLQQIA